jgi:hypoxanthine phosphoribosyltransferase
MADPLRLEPLFTSGQIEERLDALAHEIARALPRDFVAVAILKGSFIFAADLIRSLTAHGLNPDVDFMTLASYGLGTSSSGTVSLLRDVEVDVAGRHVLLIDDILDSGRTLSFARAHMGAKGAAAARSCVLLDKTAGRPGALEPDFAGFRCPPSFVVGYGMDHAHKYRGLPFVAILKAE